MKDKKIDLINRRIISKESVKRFFSEEIKKATELERKRILDLIDELANPKQSSGFKTFVGINIEELKSKINKTKEVGEE